jgi:hypothetical protein
MLDRAADGEGLKNIQPWSTAGMLIVAFLSEPAKRQATVWWLAMCLWIRI